MSSVCVCVWDSGVSTCAGHEGTHTWQPQVSPQGCCCYYGNNIPQTPLKSMTLPSVWCRSEVWALLHMKPSSSKLHTTAEMHVWHMQYSIIYNYLTLMWFYCFPQSSFLIFLNSPNLLWTVNSTVKTVLWDVTSHVCIITHLKHLVFLSFPHFGSNDSFVS